MAKSSRKPVLSLWFEQYLEDEDTARFLDRVSSKYSLVTLERLSSHGQRMARRGAVLALGFLADYSFNAVLGRALHDPDRGVRLIADNGIRLVWCRGGNDRERRTLETIVRWNTSGRHKEALLQCNQLIDEVASFAEVWNQRAIARYCLGQYPESIQDCSQALELNPYHFGAAAGMAQCHVKLGDQLAALECFEWALKLNPNLEGVRASVVHLRRTLNRP